MLTYYYIELMVSRGANVGLQENIIITMPIVQIIRMYYVV